MAILQLSRITHRKGLAENLPQLAGAEFGWVLDERKLFIGNGTIEDGAPVIGNTEILTEFSDILSLASTYTYKGLAAGYVVSTGENDEDIVRSLQSKFDDMASVKDFGAVGDGEVDDTDAINRALYELFCREVNPEVRRSLFFPAGRYKVTGKLKIPPHAKLYGEGLTSSIILYVSPDSVAATAIEVGKRYAITTPGTTTWTAIGAPNNLADTIFIATGVGAGDGTAREVVDSVVESADALHQIGGNIGNNGAEAPTGIEMVSMAVHSTEQNTLLKLNSITNSGFHYLGLYGPVLDEGDIVSNTTGTAAIALTSVGSIPTHDVTISKISTHGTQYGLRASGNVKGVVLENSGLDYHTQGVHLHNPLYAPAEMVPGNRYKIITVGTTDFTLYGAPNNQVSTEFTCGSVGAGTGTVINLDEPSPTGVVISRNIFDNIAFEGIHFHNVLFNSSGFNVFYNVANAFGSTAAAPVIHMETDKCVSVGDLFERDDESIHPRIDLRGNGGIALDSTHSIHLGSYERVVGIEAILNDNVAGGSIFTLDHNTENSYRIDYNIKRGTESRMGWLYVSNDSVTVNFNEEYTQTNDLGVTLDVVGSGTDSELQFTTTSTGDDAIFNYSVVRLD